MNFRTILILGALTAFGPLAIDFYLPAFPSMALAFGTDIQLITWNKITILPIQITSKVFCD